MIPIQRYECFPNEKEWNGMEWNGMEWNDKSSNVKNGEKECSARAVKIDWGNIWHDVIVSISAAQLPLTFLPMPNFACDSIAERERERERMKGGMNNDGQCQMRTRLKKAPALPIHYRKLGIAVTSSFITSF